MKRIIFAYLFLQCVLLLNAQELTKDTVIPLPALQHSIDSMLNSEKKISDNMNIATPAYFTPYTISNFRYTVPIGYYNDYTRYWNDKVFFSIIGSSDVWTGITTINKAAFNLHYSNNNIFRIDIGTSLWKYDERGYSFNDVLFSAHASYLPVPWLTLGVYGQYSAFSERNFNKSRMPSILPTPMIPYTSFGGYSKVMFNSTFGVKGGIGMQFNPIIGKWETTYSIGPAIEFKKKKKKRD